MRASWRRRTRRPRALFLVGYLAFVLAPVHVVAIATGSTVVSPVWTYTAGMLFGVGLTLFIVMRDTPPAQVAQWELGAWGEQWTAKELRPLRRRGWTVLHDRLLNPDRPQNVDHVIVGPAGVHVLDSKRWPGTVHIDPITGRVTVTSPDAPDLRSNRGGVDGAARGLAFDVCTHLKLTHGEASWVQAVVVIWGDFPQQALRVRNVDYVAGSHLRTWLLAHPPKTQRVHPDEVAAVLRVLPAA